MKKALAVSVKQRDELLALLEARFVANPNRHASLDWVQVRENLVAQPTKLWSLLKMEETGGEPDVVCLEQDSAEILFCDCSAESPKGRRGLCYDSEALDARREHKPKDSALGLAAAMGIEILTEATYRALQLLEPFDTKTSSWLATPPEIRKLGGAIFGDRRYDQVFIYHNGASSYYAARGFRGCVRI
jgi:hypothetical protein